MRIYLRAVLPDQDSPIFASHDDSAVIPADAYPDMATLGNVPLQYIGRSPDGMQQMLLKTWREALPTIIAGEVTRRIDVVFPVAAQARAALAATFGGEVDRDEIKRGIDYITAIRANAKALIERGSYGPCSDENWPKLIERIKV